MINNCGNIGSVFITSSYERDGTNRLARSEGVGGICGLQVGENYITNSWNRGEINTSAVGVGGIIGWNERGKY